MFRLLIILAVGFAASQFPAFYLAYLTQVDRDLVAAQQANLSAASVAELKDQRAALLQADEFQRPLALLDAWDGERFVAALGRLEPQLPDSEDALIHGAVGLVAAYLLTGILFAPFRGPRHQPQVARPATAQARARPTAKAQPKKSRSAIPITTGNLREMKAIAKAAMREARNAVHRPARADSERAGDADAAPDRDSQPVTPGLRGTDAIVFGRPRPHGAVTMTYDRPPLISRRRVMSHGGPIERVTLLRD